MMEVDQKLPLLDVLIKRSNGAVRFLSMFSERVHTLGVRTLIFIVLGVIACSLCNAF